jgi:hypothetical protein
LCVINSENERSEFSSVCTVKTTSNFLVLGFYLYIEFYIIIKEEPITGEALHKAITLDRKSDVEKILDSPDGQRVLEIPDKLGNLPLMICVNKNNIE